MTLSKSTIQISLFIVVLAGLALYNFMGAQTWTAPSANPPANNTAAPVNIGSGAQTKAGNLTVADLGAMNVWGTNMLNANFVRAGVQMRSNAYCDVNGANCFNPWAVQPKLNTSCPAGQAVIGFTNGAMQCGAFTAGPAGPAGPASRCKFYTNTACGSVSCDPGDSPIGRMYDAGPDCSRSSGTKLQAINCSTC